MPATNQDLEHFFGAYFHQDWIDEHSSWQEVVAVYVRHVGSTQAMAIAHGIEQLVLSSISNDELSKLLQHQFGCYYWPGSNAEIRPWFNEVAAYILGLPANKSFKADA